MHGGTNDSMPGGMLSGIPQQPPPATSQLGITAPSLSPLPMGDQQHQGDFGEMFIETLAVAANLDIMKPGRRDRIGLDWVIHYPGRGMTMGFPAISVQVKSWSHPTGNDTDFRYPLDVHNFNKLAGPEYQIPRFLFLVVVPTDADDWIHVDTERLILRHAAYWACFHDEAPLSVAPQSRTHTVSVPRSNLLNVASLHGLFAPSFREKLVAQ